MESLQKLVDTINVKKALANSEPGEDPRNYAAKKGHIQRAKLDLEELYMEYRKEVQSRALFIIVSGTQAEKFAKIAEEEFFCYQMDSDGFYEDLVSEVHERLYTNQTASPSLFDILGGTFERRAMDIGIIGYPALIFESKYKKFLKNKEDLLFLAKKAFNEKVGPEILGLDAVEKISTLAINSEDDEKKVLKKFPIVMVTKDESLVKDLAKGLSFVSNSVYIISAGTVKDKGVKENSVTSLKSTTKATVEKSLVKINEISK